MALDIRVEDGLPIVADQARNILQHETDTFGLFLDLDRIIEYELTYMRRRDEALEKYYTMMDMDIKPSQRQKIKDWFMATFNVPERLMLNKANKVAFDKEVQANLLSSNISEDAKEFLRVYTDWSYNQYRITYFKQYKNLPISYELSDRGHRMVVANPEWSVLTTGRIAAENPSIQNIAKDMCDLVCCPKGWKLIRCDSGQIEPRITYSHFIEDHIVRGLIMAYDDAYYGMLHYCQLPDEIYDHLSDYAVEGTPEAETKDETHIIHKHEISEEMKAGRKELKVLALAANYGSALAGRDPFLSRRYTDRIVNNRDRKRWEAEVTRQVKLGKEYFYSVFGTKIVPEESERYHRGMSSWQGHVIRCGINNPIQATASDLMCCSVYAASRILEKAKKSHIAFYKHDEGAFYIHESELGLVDELRDITAYNVTENGREWIPIHAELEEGQLENPAVPTVM